MKAYEVIGAAVQERGIPCTELARPHEHQRRASAPQPERRAQDRRRRVRIALRRARPDARRLQGGGVMPRNQRLDIMRRKLQRRFKTWKGRRA